MKDVPNMFGSMGFNDSIMKEKLPKDIYQALKKTISQGTHLELDVANVVAGAMKEWAVEKGVTHFTHWFQPMTVRPKNTTASFLPSATEKSLWSFP